MAATDTEGLETTEDPDETGDVDDRISRSRLIISWVPLVVALVLVGGLTLHWLDRSESTVPATIPSFAPCTNPDGIQAFGKYWWSRESAPTDWGHGPVHGRLHRLSSTDAMFTADSGESVLFHNGFWSLDCYIK